MKGSLFRRFRRKAKEMWLRILKTNRTAAGSEGNEERQFERKGCFPRVPQWTNEKAERTIGGQIWQTGNSRPIPAGAKLIDGDLGPEGTCGLSFWSADFEELPILSVIKSSKSSYGESLVFLSVLPSPVRKTHHASGAQA